MKKVKNKKLKSGFTTGAAAAASAKGALSLIIDGRKAPDSVKVGVIGGGSLDIPISSALLYDEKKARCTVIKDAGDDPDITHRAVIGADVVFTEKKEGLIVEITGGEGVGVVTKPGLAIEPFNAAINPGPLKMIRSEIIEVLKVNGINGIVHVEIFVPDGKKLSKKTLNSRLGILNGISILGTTGVVRPMSHEAYIATIDASLSVAASSHQRSVVLTTGRRSERFAQNLFPDIKEEAFIQIGDFFKKSIDTAVKYGFNGVILTVFFGKAVKMACGVPHTHAAKSDLSLSRLAKWTMDVTGDSVLSESVLGANTARHAFDLFGEKKRDVVFHVGKRMKKSAEKFADNKVTIRAVIFDFNGEVFFDSERK